MIISTIVIAAILFFFGRFEREYYTRTTTVRRHDRVGTRNGVRTHTRRLTDGKRIIWVWRDWWQCLLFNKKTPTTIKSKFNKNDHSAICFNHKKTDEAINHGFNHILKSVSSPRLIMLSINGKLRIFDRYIKHHDVNTIFLFSPVNFEKLEYNLADLEKDLVKDFTNKFSHFHFKRYLQEQEMLKDTHSYLQENIITSPNTTCDSSECNGDKLHNHDAQIAFIPHTKMHSFTTQREKPIHSTTAKKTCITCSGKGYYTYNEGKKIAECSICKGYGFTQTSNSNIDLKCTYQNALPTNLSDVDYEYIHYEEQCIEGSGCISYSEHTFQHGDMGGEYSEMNHDGDD